MTIESALARVSSIQQSMADPATLIGSSGGTEAPSSESAATSASFASALQQASGAYESPSASTQMPTATGSGAELDTATQSATASLLYPELSQLGVSPYPTQSVDGVAGSTAIPAAGGGGSEIVAIAESQLGQTEQPPGSNESPAIAQYRTATAGAVPGAPWCAYFASWAARQAGEPIGAAGQGLGSVSEIWSWAQSAGRAITNGPGVVPKPGDLIVFGDQHVGIVKDVLPNGQIQTIEGNYENKVAANVRSPSEATGYVEMS
jgi:surface antigen